MSALRLAAWMLLPLGFGCATMQAADQASHLEMSLLSYARLMRWGQFEDASHYHRALAGEALGAQLPGREIRVTAFDLGTPGAVRPATETEPAQALVPVVLSYYSDTSAVVVRQEYVQHWWFEAEGRQWFVADPFPNLGGATP